MKASQAARFVRIMNAYGDKLVRMELIPIFSADWSGCGKKPIPLRGSGVEFAQKLMEYSENGHSIQFSDGSSVENIQWIKDVNEIMAFATLKE